MFLEDYDQERHERFLRKEGYDSCQKKLLKEYGL